MSSLSCHPSAGSARPHNYGTPRRPIYQRRSSTSRGSTSASSTSSFSDDEDAITPCPPQSFSEERQKLQEQQDRSPRPQPRSPKSHRPNAEGRHSWRSSQVMSDEPHPESPDGEVEVDSVTLWRRMLAIQRMFGCYNSARMRAALDSGLEDGFVPSRTCLDLLNDSIDQLPEESRRQLEHFLEHGESGHAPRRKSWRQRLQEMRQAR